MLKPGLLRCAELGYDTDSEADVLVILDIQCLKKLFKYFVLFDYFKGISRTRMV
jgi:hypothetical protein